MTQSISILIPVFNRPVIDLVTALHRQISEIGTMFEILVIDDKSDQKTIVQNASIGQLSNVVYICLDNNIGRSRIRNLLASKAKYDKLLFLDCDSGIIHDNFLATYLDMDEAVCYGGTQYQRNKPEKKYQLHWQYGRKYEAISAVQREQNPYTSFRTNNFMIRKSIMKVNPFDEEITEYGHEDTLFALQLQSSGLSICHIDNPVLHQGLEDKATFINKTEISLISLNKIKNRHPIFNTRLIALQERFSKHKYISLILEISYPFIKKCLEIFPNVYLYQLYKLSYTIGLK